MPRAVQQAEVLHLSRWLGQPHRQSDAASQQGLKGKATLTWVKEGEEKTRIPLALLRNNKRVLHMFVYRGEMSAKSKNSLTHTCYSPEQSRQPKKIQAS